MLQEKDRIDVKIARVHRLATESAIKAFVDVNINDSLLIKGFRIVEGPRGFFVTMPQEKGKNDRWYNTVHCLSTDIKNLVVDSVLKAYREQQEQN